jgi:chromosome segregation ATPase
MSTNPSESRKGQLAAAKDDRVQYVEELAGPEEYPPGDAWISLTDAARVTRTSEAMARRWVTSGRLPVKKEAVGIPPRTRLVRISDVAKIRPIVDPTAAITGDVRKLDLPSIPRQQQQIMQNYQRILDETAALRQTVDHFTEETREVWQVHQQQYQVLTHRDDEQQQHLQQVRDSLTESLHRLDRSLQKALAELREQFAGQLEETRGTVTTHHGELERLSAALSGMARQLQEERSGRETQGRQLEEQSQTIAQVARDLAALEERQQAALEKQFQEVSRTVEQAVRDFTTDIETLSRDQAQDVAMLTEGLEHLTQRIEQVATKTEAVQDTTLGYQQRADGLEGRLQELWKLLQGEIAARQALEQQVQQSLPTRKRAT